MTTCVRSPNFFKNRKQRRERQLRKLANMRAAKERKRLANPVQREPKMKRYYPLEFGIREKQTGDIVFIDLRSTREVARKVSAILRYIEPA